MVADPFFWEKAQKLNQWLFLQVGLSLCDRLTFAILCFGLLQLFSTVLSESEFFFLYEFGFRFYGVDFLTNARKIYLHDIHVSKDNQDDWFSFYVL